MLLITQPKPAYAQRKLVYFCYCLLKIIKYNSCLPLYIISVEEDFISDESATNRLPVEAH